MAAARHDYEGLIRNHASQLAREARASRDDDTITKDDTRAATVALLQRLQQQGIEVPSRYMVHFLANQELKREVKERAAARSGGKAAGPSRRTPT